MSRRHRRKNGKPGYDVHKISSQLLGALQDREIILPREGMYRLELDWFQSGGSFFGRLPMPVGLILELWQESPMFTLPDGRKIFQYQGGLSGACSGWAIDTETGDISSFQSNAENKLSFPLLWREAARIWTRNPDRGSCSSAYYDK